MKTTKESKPNEHRLSGAGGRRTLLAAVTGVLAVTVFLLAASAASLAAACGGGNVQDYINLGAGGCTYNDLKFSDFAYTGSATGTDALKASDITVGQDFLEGSGYGLIFSANWSVKGADLDSKITYDVTVLNKMSLVGETLLMNGASFTGDGEDLATEFTFNADLETVLWKEGNSTSDSANFAVQKSDSVETDVSVSAGPFSNANIDSVSNLFDVEAAQAPEPGSPLLLGSGVIGLSGYLRKRLMARS